MNQCRHVLDLVVKAVLVVVLAFPWISAVADTGGPYQATGIRIGEVTDAEAIVWTRLTRIAERVGFDAPMPTILYRDPETGKPSTSIGTDEYIKPETIFLDIETVRDVTADEFRYVLGNILRSTRYGAISSRIGKIKNVLAGVILSDCEVFSNLELTQAVYDRLRGEAAEPDFPLRIEAVVKTVRAAADELAERVVGQLTILPHDEVTALVDEITMFYRDESPVKAMLEAATQMYGPQG